MQSANDNYTSNESDDFDLNSHVEDNYVAHLPREDRPMGHKVVKRKAKEKAQHRVIRLSQPKSTCITKPSAPIMKTLRSMMRLERDRNQ